jgi:MFS family permease
VGPDQESALAIDCPDSGERSADAVPVVGLRNETELERFDRNLNELLSELRVALPGVQVLFAFLLVAPFNQRFAKLTAFERHLYLVTLLSTLLAAILLIAPTLIHRFHFRLGEKPYVVHLANRLMVAGLSVFAFAMTTAVLLITLYVFGVTAAVVTTALVAATFALVWFMLPLRRRRLRARLRATRRLRPWAPEPRDSVTAR